jgi:type I restriction enzyme, S subunit
MPNEYWSSTTLGAIAAGTNGLVDGPFGSNLPASAYTLSGIPVVRGSNLSLGESRFNDHEFVYVSDETAARLARSICWPGDIVFTKKGTIGQTGFIPPRGRFDKYLLSSNQMKLSVDPEKADALFVYYVVSTPENREKLIRDASITGVPKTNVAYLREFPIKLPRLSEQRAIAHILGTLDDKIELNRRMNETLEAMARALYKSWFVDFDPVRTKVEGHDPGLPKPLGDLFPDSFEDSGLGQIPKGWNSSNNLLFLGCSLGPDRTIQLVAEIAKSDKNMPKHYALLALPDTDDVRVDRENFLTERGIYPIWYDGGHDESITALLAGLLDAAQTV